MDETFDFIVVGSGSAGSVLAHRLSEDGRNTVLVLEYGGSDWGPFIQMPSALSYPMNMNLYNWGFETEPEPHLNGRRLATPRGKVVGGSSSINGMVYVRGHARDFDAWEEMGAKGWGFRHVQPYFKRMENSHGGIWCRSILRSNIRFRAAIFWCFQGSPKRWRFIFLRAARPAKLPGRRRRQATIIWRRISSATG